MTSYYKGNTIGLNYDAANATWSFTNEPNDFIDPASFSTADPAFEYAPPPSTDDDQDDDFNPCPAGYIYDSTLKQCVIDPNQQTSYQQDIGGGDPDQPQATRVEFDASTPEGRKEMYEHGLGHGYFTTDTSKGGAYEFLGPKKTGMKLLGLQGIAQFGEDREYQRYINELAKEDAKRKAAGQPAILAQAVGFFGLSKTFVDEQKPVFGDITSQFNKKVDSFKTATLNAIKVEGTGDASIAERIAAEERARKAKFDADISEEKAKREMQKTIAEAEEREKTIRELEELQTKKDKERKDIEKEKEKRNMQETIRKAEKKQQVKEEYRDKGQVTYKPKETGGYVTTKNIPSAPPRERGGGGYTKPTSYERPGTKGAPGRHW